MMRAYGYADTVVIAGLCSHTIVFAGCFARFVYGGSFVRLPNL